jgi:glycosyltransferase involved in cell wall biosynthesis
LLGNRATAQQTLGILQNLSGITVTPIMIGLEDYGRYSVPWWAAASSPLKLQCIARQKAGSIIPAQFDLFFVNCWEFMVAFQQIARQIPAAALMDSVPTSLEGQVRRRGAPRWQRALAYPLNHYSFKRAVGSFEYFLPMGSDCARALVRDYGVASDRCSVTLAPQDTQNWTASTRDWRAPLKLLFVGNDFCRKGGDFLIRLYREHLAARYELTIVSNDASLAGRALPVGVQWLRGRTRDELLGVYRSHHVFVFPSQQDYMPQVIAEAMSTGLPCMATDVGGIPDLIEDGESGYIMSLDAPTSAWADRLDYLAATPSELQKMSACARRLAEQNLGLDRFGRVLADVVSRLCANGHSCGA